MSDDRITFLSRLSGRNRLQLELDRLRGDLTVEPPPLLRKQCKTVAALMDWFRASARIIAVPRCLTLTCGDGNAAMLLAQLLYWLDKRKDGASRGGVKIDDQVYIANTHADWSFQTGLPQGKVRTAIANLKKKKFVKSVRKKFKNQPMTHLTVVLPWLCDAIEVAVLKERQAREDAYPGSDPESLDFRPAW